jgi:hypothetical protein
MARAVLTGRTRLSDDEAAVTCSHSINTMNAKVGREWLLRWLQRLATLMVRRPPSTGSRPQKRLQCTTLASTTNQDSRNRNKRPTEPWRATRSNYSSSRQLGEFSPNAFRLAYPPSLVEGGVVLCAWSQRKAAVAFSRGAQAGSLDWGAGWVPSSTAFSS